MKNIFVFVLLFGNICAVFAGEEVEIKKSISEFSITERKTDLTLTTGSARFKFSFYTNGKLYTKSLDIGTNGETFIATPDKYGWVKTNVKKGKYKLYFYVEGFQEVITDSIEIKSQEVILAKIQFNPNYNIHTITEKPVIYVYPKEKTEINIQLTAKGKLSFTYPKYENGWNFTATPNGTISMGDKEYNYLFWESNMDNLPIKDYIQTGFLVSTDTLLNFLENSLNQMGLNSKESADFITYWYPRMVKNETNFIHFLFNEECNAYAELEINPKPQTIFRVGMIWSPTIETTIIPERQEIVSFKREGLTVVEWGGVEVGNIFSKEN